LLDDTATIGSRAGWNDRLRKRGYALRGHELVQSRRSTGEIPIADRTNGTDVEAATQTPPDLRHRDSSQAPPFVAALGGRSPGRPDRIARVRPGRLRPGGQEPGRSGYGPSGPCLIDGPDRPVTLDPIGQRIAGSVVNEGGRPSAGRSRDRARRSGTDGPAGGPAGCVANPARRRSGRPR
jgi:hypothetical protein